MQTQIRYPAANLAVPLICGILFSGSADIGDCTLTYVAICLVALGTVSGVLSCCRFPYMFFLSFSVQVFLIGFVLSESQMRTVKTCWDGSRRTYAAALQDWPVERERSFLLKLRLVSDDSVDAGTSIYLYVPKNEAARRLVPGEFVFFNGRVSKPSNEEVGFDYESYLYRHGVSGTLWVDSCHWRGSGLVSHTGRIKYAMARARRAVLERYRCWGLRDKTLAVVTAVTVADKSLLDEDVKESFSVSGTSHLLAVSGLHVGIMYAFLSLLIPHTGLSVSRFIKESFIISALWMYSCLLGMPLSIVRSVIMFSVATVARFLGRDSSPMNALFLAASLILLLNPFGIYDAGFQMSFLSVLSIIIVQPGLSSLVTPRNPILKYVWDIVSVSVAAQIGTAPLTVYLFENFPIYFILANIVAIPVMFAVVSGAMLLWLVAWIPVLCRIVVFILAVMVAFLDKMLDVISALPGAGFQIDIENASGVCVLYAVVIMLCLFFRNRKIRYLVYALSLCAVSDILGLI